ncbi:MAG: TetR/AcrR family transcriptional regulator [Bacteroidetes bacterium]|nr:MAG: TetR/AcrR family transcriptional regulator [Bacteroidota bacterium]
MPRTEVFDREEVLEKAKNIFWFKGYNGTSMQDLVDATGLNRSSIYNSFGNKMELYLQTLKKYQGDISDLFDKANKQERNAIETIGLIFLYVLEDILEDTEEKGCMLINCRTEMGNHDNQLHELLEADQERLLGIFQNLVSQGQAEGSILTGEKSELLAYYLVNAFQGFRISGMNIKDTVILKSIIQNILKTIAR